MIYVRARTAFPLAPSSLPLRGCRNQMSGICRTETREECKREGPRDLLSRYYTCPQQGRRRRPCSIGDRRSFPLVLTTGTIITYTRVQILHSSRGYSLSRLHLRLASLFAPARACPVAALTSGFRRSPPSRLRTVPRLPPAPQAGWRPVGRPGAIGRPLLAGSGAPGAVPRPRLRAWCLP